MTLIIGLNFSNKLYIAGDTRVTRFNLETGDKIGVDNIVKVMPLWSKSIKGQAFNNRDVLTMAVSGDVEFATFIYEELKTAIAKKELSSDIRELNNQILDYIKNITNKWLEKREFQSCAFIISGMTQRRKKLVSKEKLSALIEEHNRSKEKSKPFRDDFIAKTLPSDQTWKVLQEKIKKDSGKTVVDLLNESTVATIPDWTDEALSSGENLINMPDSLIIGVDVRPSKKILIKETAEWGEFLAYGAGLTKDDLPQDLLANIELSHVKEEKLGPHLLDGAMITNTIEDIARERAIESIGGSVVMLLTEQDGSVSIQGKDVFFPSNKYEPLGLILMNTQVPLVPFYMYPKPKLSKESAEM